MGLHFAGDVPFREVAIHGLVRDAEGRKMSKSFGNVVDPLEMADELGADALRFTLVRSGSPGQDVPLAREWVEGGRNFINKLWNASRFVSMNLDGSTLAQLEGNGLSGRNLPLPDRWILSRLGAVVRAVDEGFERYDFADGVRELQSFTWGEFCDWYLELAKLPLAAGEVERARVQDVLATTLGTILRLLHPIVPFVTEELWNRLGGEGLVMTTTWPDPAAFAVDEEAEAAMAAVIDIVSAIRRFRSEHSLAPSKRLVAYVVPADPGQAAALESLAAEVRALAGLGQLELVESRQPQPGEQRLVAAGAAIALPLEGVIDVGAARDGLDKQIQRHRSELEKIERKLGDDSFLTRAPAQVVEDQRRRQAATREALDTLVAQRQQLG
jgi:valyl-tRNA synthetase